MQGIEKITITDSLLYCYKLLESVQMVHEKNIAHGNLNWNNVYLMEMFSVTLGDFKYNRPTSGKKQKPKTTTVAPV